MNAPADGAKDSPSLTALLREAENYRQQKIWEAAIPSYQKALKLEPGHVRSHLGLGHVYAAKGQEAGSRGFLLLSAEHFRKALATDPNCREAHESLLAVTAKMGQWDELLQDYKARLVKDPENPSLKDAMKKIQAAFLLRTTPSAAPPKPQGLLWTFFNVGLPLLGFVSFFLALIFRIQNIIPSWTTLYVGFLRMGTFFFVVYFLLRLFLK
ncbi:MAG TPA: tetratricopeptide repeat protein [Elusimicrobiota bacterium]|nr:tetratricopeptide repeat protein [Elusimicrobiota bacterium]